MKKDLLLVFGAILIAFTTNAQFNEYKYVVVPIKFSAFKNQNQFKTSTIIKYELARKGLNVAYSDNLPEELKNNRCLGLNLDLLDDSGMFATRVILAFTNCDGVEVYRSKEGKSKDKNFEVSYREAIQDASASMDPINYAYQEPATQSDQKAQKETVTIPIGNDIKEIKKDTITINMGNDIKQVDETPLQTDVQEQQINVVEKVEDSEVTKEEVSIQEEKEPMEETIQTLYAQSVGEGYQLVDTSPKVVYELTPTTLQDTFLVKGVDESSGILYKKDGKWILEYESKNGKVVRELNVKF
ncbi:hypothetical protein [Croceivirga thetidis]|uniref:Secreted protein n=1 Tax=Croceivirga thetidis TaxID=2721623 RepID=A0ABX1GUB1_9FLAO|nr:hypothetical protein [Croceivirga thetidis]NKI33243.1 hypothetical protein [Croceivirga thetidis]